MLLIWRYRSSVPPDRKIFLKNVHCESPKAARGYAVRDGKDLQRCALFNFVKSVSVKRERSVDVNSFQFITAQYILI